MRDKKMNHFSDKWGIYVHIPFCLNKCLYCDFYSVTDLSIGDAYVSALCEEIKIYSKIGEINDSIINKGADTIYFGGGTPSLLGGKRIGKIVQTIRECFKISDSSEITIEANPGAASDDDLKSYVDSGINRINFGVQSFNDSHLKTLGRIHSSGQAEKAVNSAIKAGFRNIGLDIIFAIPGQSHEELEEDIRKAAGFHPDHISCYCLSFEEGTPLHSAMLKGLIEPADEDLAASMFISSGETLAELNYKRYEISNFGKITPDGEVQYSRHNMKYWTHAPYLGFGPAAHSFDGSKRWWKDKDLNAWISSIMNGKDDSAGEEMLTLNDLMTETIFLGLRTSYGVDLADFKKKYGFDLEKKIGPAMEFYESEGFAIIASGHLMLTEKGMLAADAITREILDEI